MGQSASFPFEIGEPNQFYANRTSAYWQLFAGKRKVRAWACR